MSRPTAQPIEETEGEPVTSDDYFSDDRGLQGHHRGGLMRRRYIPDEDRLPVELDHFVDPSEIWG